MPTQQFNTARYSGSTYFLKVFDKISGDTKEHECESFEHLKATLRAIRDINSYMPSSMELVPVEVSKGFAIYYI